ncbi:Transcription initiation factor TFIID subunit 1 [Gurleya vavrai]
MYKIEENKPILNNENIFYISFLKFLNYKTENFDFDSFLVFVATKYLKRHKYMPRLNITFPKTNQIKIFKKELHKQFTVYYISQKYGSQLYLNAKALENLLESTIIDYMPFEAMIPMDENFFKISENIFSFVNLLKEIGPFKHPVKFTELCLFNYIDIIRFPIDLEIIEFKIKNDKYKTFEIFINDIFSLFINGMEFNIKDSELHNLSKKLFILTQQKIIEEINANFNLKINFDSNNDNIDIFKHLKKFKQKKIVFKIIEDILEDTKKIKEAALYIDDSCNIESMKIIKKPMSLNKMINKVRKKEYISIGHVMNDMNLIVKNCVLLNGSSTWIVRVCKKMENYFKKELSYAFSLRNLNLIKSN